MVLVIGGAGQGKLDFAKKTLHVTAWSENPLGPEDCIYGLHQFVRECPDAKRFVREWCAEHPQGVIICDEVGCGVTPLDRAERDWREAVGRLCCELAEQAEAVYRVSCGLGVRIK